MNSQPNLQSTRVVFKITPQSQVPAAHLKIDSSSLNPLVQNCGGQNDPMNIQGKLKTDFFMLYDAAQVQRQDNKVDADQKQEQLCLSEELGRDEELSPSSRRLMIEKYREKRRKRMKPCEPADSYDSYSSYNNSRPDTKKRFLQTPFALRMKNRIIETRSLLRKFGRQLKLRLKSEAYGKVLTAVDKKPRIYYN
eukprot:TRINITY_DN10248_c0_g1_i11.p1 TRINITY_DN10248_c0_g1~~TRINITY_DN10248_c0_g1_i11.p1  ORF type:complete len:194 (+),score=35.42 TRINITY_DN10248_c0_g1_i11:213-794(+)